VVAMPVLHVDPRLIDAVVEFTGEVQLVAADLADAGAPQAERLCAALDRLNGATAPGRAVNGDWPPEDRP